MEVYYNFVLTSWFSLTPSLQLVRPATSGEPLLSVVGLRSVVRL